MEESKLIVFAMLMGLTAFVFTTVPFSGVIISGIAKDENRNNDKNIVEIFVKAFTFHIVSVLLLILIFSLLDMLLSGIETNFVKGKCMQEIFWVAENKGTVMTNAGISDMGYESDGAYSALKTVYLLIQIFYAFLPLFVFTLSAYVGFEVEKKKQDTSPYKIMVSVLTYTILGMFVYNAWIVLSDLAMYLPDGETLMSLKDNYWKKIFNIT